MGLRLLANLSLSLHLSLFFCTWSLIMRSIGDTSVSSWQQFSSINLMSNCQLPVAKASLASTCGTVEASILGEKKILLCSNFDFEIICLHWFSFHWSCCPSDSC